MHWHDLRREPYRLLFPLGIVFGCLGVSQWLWYAFGWLPASKFYHTSMQLGAYLVCMIAGFLMTALPRMAHAAPASSAELGALLGLLGAQVALLGLGRTAAAQACFAGLLLVLLAFAGRRFVGRRSPIGAPVEFLWVPIGVGFGLVGTTLAVLSQRGLMAPTWINAARPLAQQGFVLAVVLGVGGFLGPRLMGRGFEVVGSTSLVGTDVRRQRRRRMAWYLVAAAALVVSFLLEGLGHTRLAYFVRAAVVTAELLWTTKLHQPPRVRDLYVWLLWVSLWMTALGYWAVSIWPRYRVGLLHLTLMGGFSLMVFAVGTMVVLSHAGEADALRKPLWVLKVAAIGVIGATAMRILADLWPSGYFPSLAIAALLWLTAAISWLLFIGPRMLRTAPPHTFERLHEQAKQQLLREVRNESTTYCS